jgi:hypothetical protein
MDWKAIMQKTQRQIALKRETQTHSARDSTFLHHYPRYQGLHLKESNYHNQFRKKAKEPALSETVLLTALSHEHARARIESDSVVQRCLAT